MSLSIRHLTWKKRGCDGSMVSNILEIVNDTLEADGKLPAHREVSLPHRPLLEVKVAEPAMALHPYDGGHAGYLVGKFLERWT